jgi:peptidoglycan/LPS O-acetylase OafA/YrhL
VAVSGQLRSSEHASSTGADHNLRPDIQALRAVAVGAVLLYHLWPLRLTGGFVGVDVFFVISGFLITSHLRREIVSSGTIKLGRFWARRATRLLPAAFLVLACTGVATVLVVPRSLWHQFLWEILGSAVYAQNWVLAANSVDYLAKDNSPSPVQHFWTLSVEEQFYVALPLLMLLATLLAGPAHRASRRVLGSLIGVIGLASLVLSVATSSRNPTAYFSTGTRAWEFAAGALIAVLGVRLHGVARHVAAVLGLGCIAWSVWFFSGATVFPGIAAGLPVLGTVLVIVAGRGSVMDFLGRIRWVGWLGGISYAVYLWHWPLIVLVPYVTSHPLTTVEKVAIGAAALLIATVSTRFVENPVRQSPRLLGRRRPRAVLVWVAAGMVVVSAVPIVTLVVMNRTSASEQAQLQALLAGAPRCLGAQAMDPALAPCTNPELDGLLLPAVADAQRDDSNDLACWSKKQFCTYGPATGYEKRLLAVGDSHNNTLIEAYRKIADSRHWRIDVVGNGGCYFTGADLKFPTDFEKACRDWRLWLIDQVDRQLPDLDGVITIHHANGTPPYRQPGQSAADATVQGLVAAWKPVVDAGVPVLAIQDFPEPPRTGFACVEAEGLASPDGCALPRATMTQAFDGSKEAAAALGKGVRLIDLNDLLCKPATCSQIIGHVVVYRPDGHLTKTYVSTLVPYLDRAFAAALAG